jgi:hypothetical protein
MDDGQVECPVASFAMALISEDNITHLGPQKGLDKGVLPISDKELPVLM